MRILIALLLTVLSCLGQGGSYCTMSTWEPRNIGTKAGLVASHDPGNASTVTLNGVGVSKLDDRARSIRTGNLLLQSETFATTWTRTRVNAFGVTDVNERSAGSGSFANSLEYTDPLGGNTADFIQEDGTAASTHFISQNFALTAGTYTLSVWVKPAGISWFRLRADQAVAHGCYFNVTTGAKGIETLGTGSITSAGSGWYLCTLKFTEATGAATLYVMTADSDGGQTHNGDNTSGLLIWGASIVASDWTQVTGPTLAQGYQVTTTAPYSPPNIIQPTAAAQPLISRTDGAGNILKQSEDFSATWTRTQLNAFGSGSVANATNAPDGTLTADFLQENSTAAVTHYTEQTVSIPNIPISYSTWAKYNGRQWIRISIGDATPTFAVRCWFDIQNGVVGTASSVGAGSGAAGAISENPVGSGWYLCTLTGTPGGTSTTARIFFATSDTGTTYNGDNTSGVFFWGASIRASPWITLTGTNAVQGYVATTTQPIFPGLAGRSVMYFDGAGMYLKSGYGSTFTAFPLVQPEEVYLAAMQWTWTSADRMFDGDTANSGCLRQITASPQLQLFAGSAGAYSTGSALGSWSVLRCAFAGVSSFIEVNSTLGSPGDVGAGNMGGFTLGSLATSANHGNVLVARSLICSKTNAPAEANYLAFGLLKQCGVK